MASPAKRSRGQHRAETLSTAFRFLLLVRVGNRTVPALADELGCGWRTVYRIIHALEDAGIPVALVPGPPTGCQGPRPSYIRIHATDLRRALHL